MQDFLFNKMKTGRPPSLGKDRKSKITGLRLKEDERALLDRAAKKHQIKLSDWMRTTLVNAAKVELTQ